ncbi:metal-dependent hydrolase [Methanococcoides orientis]|uniref:metal-dependent hydrolase n=1 Tax=Methanococcoides orientis TaxID=2822137 RepID=UPI001E3F207B|nr:metal-dependent hydrolase [Methanococcoides orientis]UGV40158.1 metal-dependent hydrolase [Methanococcoides orientis]
MPYPVAHVMFFVFCICAIAVYTTLVALLRRDISYREIGHILLLLLTGGFFALYPDIMAVYNLIVNGTLAHCYIGAIPTHSLLFSSSAILIGAIIGYVLYRKPGKALYTGLFAFSASLSHLLLDDLEGTGIHYLYPISSREINLFSYIGIGFTRDDLVHSLLAAHAPIVFIFVVMMLALLALSHLGFEFRYHFKK